MQDNVGCIVVMPLRSFLCFGDVTLVYFIHFVLFVTCRARGDSSLSCCVPCCTCDVDRELLLPCVDCVQKHCGPHPVLLRLEMRRIAFQGLYFTLRLFYQHSWIFPMLLRFCFYVVDLKDLNLKHKNTSHFTFFSCHQAPTQQFRMSARFYVHIFCYIIYLNLYLLFAPHCF